ncbi:MAG TPA: hypothetical protein VHB77_02810 [Planctomycetaceae bacterium]|nr:hypothetical protein [Planctomycetaceae bacterium]
MTFDAQTCIALAIVAWAVWFLGRRVWRFARALQSAGGLRRWCSSCAGCAAGHASRQPKFVPLDSDGATRR